MKIMLKDGPDNCLRIVEVVEVCYEADKHTMYVQTSKNEYKIPNVYEMQYKDIVHELYEKGICDLSSKDCFVMTEEDWEED